MPGWAPARRLLGSARADLALALVLCAVSALDVVLSGFEPVTAVSAAVGTLPLAGRRRAPMVPAFAVLAAVLLQRVSGASMESLFALSSFRFAALVAGYSGRRARLGASRGRGRPTRGARGVVGALVDERAD